MGDQRIADGGHEGGDWCRIPGMPANLCTDSRWHQQYSIEGLAILGQPFAEVQSRCLVERRPGPGALKQADLTLIHPIP